MYRSLSYGGISLFLKAEAENRQGPKRQFYPLDMKRSIRTNLKDKTIVEHPVIYVVYKTDEHLFREDDTEDVSDKKEEKMDVFKNSGDKVNPTNLGDVMSETNAMEADPEAYKQYFDFYLKYYTQKYAQHGVTNDQIQPTLPAAMAQTPPCDTSVPPPSFSSRVHHPSVLSNIKNTEMKPEKKYQHQSTNFFFDSAEELNGENLNKKNYDEAHQLRKSLNPPPSSERSLSSLVQYDLSDSDCEN